MKIFGSETMRGVYSGDITDGFAFCEWFNSQLGLLLTVQTSKVQLVWEVTHQQFMNEK